MGFETKVTRSMLSQLTISKPSLRFTINTTSLCPVSSSQLPDPRTSGLGNLTATRGFGLLGPAPNPAFYYDMLFNLCYLFGATAIE